MADEQKLQELQELINIYQLIFNLSTKLLTGTSVPKNNSSEDQEKTEKIKKFLKEFIKEAQIDFSKYDFRFENLENLIDKFHYDPNNKDHVLYYETVLMDSIDVENKNRELPSGELLKFLKKPDCELYNSEKNSERSEQFEEISYLIYENY